jgi:hypothetical protein
LERLVRLLEGMFAGTDMKVKSPDNLEGRLSGQRREVDVSLRGKMGSASVLIILECRDRSRDADLTWIEALATKRLDVGADRAIAVTSKRFSKAARKLAEAQNIELRRIEEVGKDTFPFLGDPHAMFLIHESRTEWVRVNLSRLLGPHTLSFSREQLDCTFLWFKRKKGKNLEQFLRMAIGKRNHEVWNRIEIDERWTPWEMEFVFPPDYAATIRIDGTHVPVSSVDYMLGLRRVLVEADEDAVRAYTADDGTIVAGSKRFSVTQDDARFEAILTWKSDGSSYNVGCVQEGMSKKGKGRGPR